MDLEKLQSLPEPAQQAILQRVAEGKITVEGLNVVRTLPVNGTLAGTDGVDYFFFDATPDREQERFAIADFQPGRDKVVFTDSDASEIELLFNMRPQGPDVVVLYDMADPAGLSAVAVSNATSADDFLFI